MEDDNKVILLILNGDSSLFERLVVKYQKRLFGFIYNLVQDNFEALDLVQETLVKAYENLYKYNTDKVFSTWLFTIAKNVSFNRIKANKKYLLKERLDIDNANSNGPEDVFIRKEEVRKLYYGIDLLPEKYRELIYLKYAEGLSYEEISQKIGITTTLVESRLYMARQRLSKILREVI